MAYDKIAQGIQELCKAYPELNPFEVACNIQSAIQASAFEKYMNDKITQVEYRELGKDHIAKLIAPKFIAILEGQAA